jgi:hypothetical protein
MTPIQRIKAERQRQIDVEGYDGKHDDAHDSGELLRAAVLYYQHTMLQLRMEPPLKLRGDGAPIGWPWEAEWWKPKNHMQNLERAGALCLAEKDRLLRCRGGWVEHVNQKLRLICAAIKQLDEAASNP